MIRNSRFFINFHQTHSFRLSECLRISSLTNGTEKNVKIKNTTFDQSDSNSRISGKNTTIVAASLSFLGAVSYYLYNDEFKDYFQGFYLVHALNKEKTKLVELIINHSKLIMSILNNRLFFFSHKFCKKVASL